MEANQIVEIPVEEYPLPDNWSNFLCTNENILNAYQKFSQFPILFDDIVRGNFQTFIDELLDTRSIVLATGDYGLCRIAKIIPGRSCNIHLTFWDRRFRGRDGECKQAIKWLFHSMLLQRATIQVPEVAHYTANFVQALGFKREGRVRDAWSYKGKLVDIFVFGILRNEVFVPSQVVEQEQVKIEEAGGENGKS